MFDLNSCGLDFSLKALFRNNALSKRLREDILCYMTAQCLDLMYLILFCDKYPLTETTAMNRVLPPSKHTKKAMRDIPTDNFTC